MNVIKQLFRYNLIVILCLLFISIVDSIGQIASFPYFTGFESGSFDSYWTINDGGDSRSRIQVTNSFSVYAGSYVMALDNNTTSSNITKSADLHIDLSGQTEIELEYYFQDAGDANNSDDAILFSDDGGSSFTKVFQIYPNDYSGSSWHRVVLDVDELLTTNGLAATSHFVIRFQQRGKGTLDLSSSGFKFDNVNVHYPSDTCNSPELTSLPYYNGFESGGLGQEWCIVEESQYADVITRSDFGGAFEGSEYLTIANINSSRSSSEIIKSADLYLDFSGHSDINLSYYVRDFYDESQPEDGIFFSDDGGVSFQKVIDFPSYAGHTWQKHSFNVDSILTTHSLTASDSFIVRFQQKGNSPVDLGATANDGYAFDSLLITTDFLLPSHLINFLVSNKENKVHVQWTNDQCIEMDQFVIERSFNGKDFHSIESVLATHEGDTKCTYDVYDESPKVGVNYYRLKQIDMSGNVQLSKTKAIIIKEDGLAYFKVYPNPIIKNRSINFNVSKGFEVLEATVIDGNGRILYKNIIKNVIPFSQYEIPMNLSNGNYMLSINGNQEKYTSKIVVE